MRISRISLGSRWLWLGLAVGMVAASGIGIAFASTGDTGATGAPVAPGLFAHMAADGSIIASSPNVDPNPAFTGKFLKRKGAYQIRFVTSQSLLKCAPVSTLDINQPDARVGFTTTGFSSDSQVKVHIFNRAGHRMNSSFFVIVMC